MTGIRAVQRSIIDSERLLFEKLYKSTAILEKLSSDQTDKILLDLLVLLYKSRMDGTEQIRQLRADATLSLAKILGKGGTQSKSALKDTVVAAQADERSSHVQRTLDSALRYLE